MFTAAVKYGRTAEYEADERSSITNRSTRGGVQSGATDQKGRGAMTERSVVEHTHTTHPADAECAASATAETHQFDEFVTIKISREDAQAIIAGPRMGKVFRDASAREYEAIRAALERKR